MDNFYISGKKRFTGEYEMHRSTCYRLPDEENRIVLGAFGDCNTALKKAKDKYGNVNGCFYCCNESHTEKIKKSNGEAVGDFSII